MSIAAQKANLFAKAYANMLLPGDGVAITLKKKTGQTHNTSTGLVTPTFTNYSVTGLVSNPEESDSWQEGYKRVRTVVLPAAQMPVVITLEDNLTFLGGDWDIAMIRQPQGAYAVVLGVGQA